MRPLVSNSPRKSETRTSETFAEMDEASSADGS